MGTALPEFIRAGDQTFRRADDNGFFGTIRKMLWEVDPNLELAHPEYAPQGWAILWLGPDAMWHAVMINTSGDPRQLLLAPAVMRERDNAAPHNSRESAFERDVRQAQEREAERMAEAEAHISDARQRVYHGLGKDLGVPRRRTVI
jgi:hypothetical protein